MNEIPVTPHKCGLFRPRLCGMTVMRLPGVPDRVGLQIRLGRANTGGMRAESCDDGRYSAAGLRRRKFGVAEC